VGIPAHTQAPSQSAKSAKAEEKLPDLLSRELHHQLHTLPFYSVFDFLGFTISGDTVTLTGQVLRPTLKTHAEGAVKSLEGVRTVVNNIEVLPQSAADDELRRNIYRAIFEDSELAKYAVQTVPPIHIIVSNGAVTLAGSVDNETDIALATKEASKVPNIVSLHNALALRKTDVAGK
jgi:hyperosmotically inducible periplasmic protein